MAIEVVGVELVVLFLVPGHEPELALAARNTVRLPVSTYEAQLGPQEPVERVEDVVLVLMRPAPSSTPYRGMLVASG